ncbi:MAG: flagellar hook-associated protein FlgL [Chloroflexota bacterium]|jgi:flagellar hook-associated protein 3 FlgL|uniref:Flagellar hook-associated protein 3 n=2 Tax=Bellilinea TaxID=475960 RepID=A0A7C4Q4D1_9CHLR
MRVTHQGMINNTIAHLSGNMDQIARLQSKIAAGKKNLSPSDDPVNTSQSLTMRSTLNNLQAYRSTNELTREWMEAADYSLEQLQTIGVRAVGLITRGLSDTMGSDERQHALAAEIDGMIAQVVQIGNSTHKGEYIFAGFQLHTQPFVMSDPNTLVYQGDNGLLQRAIAPGQSVVMNLPAEPVFRPLVESLIAARNALQSASFDRNALQTAFTQLESALDAVDAQRTGLGTRMRQVKAASDGIDKTEIELNSLLSKREDLNMAEAITLLRGQETTYQAVLEVSRRAISALSLFDYLR